MGPKVIIGGCVNSHRRITVLTRGGNSYRVEILIGNKAQIEATEKRLRKEGIPESVILLVRRSAKSKDAVV